MPSPFALALAKVAETEYNTFRMMDENDPPLTARIKGYWKGIATFPGPGTPWSAVFVSWCVRTAGAKASEFKFAAAHSIFVHAAIANRKSDSGVFQCFDVTEVAPNVGDIIQNNRGGNTFDYAYAAGHTQYASHTAIVIEAGTDADGPYCLTIGGNESDSIRRKIVRLDMNMRIKQRPTNRFMSVIKTLK